MGHMIIQGNFMSSPMPIFHQILIICSFFNLINLISSDCESCYMHQFIAHKKFEQKSDRFWEFNEESNTWVEVKLPYDLISCTNDNCTIVNSIQETNAKKNEETEDDKRGVKESCYKILPVRKRVSLTRMSETSVWITGVSGSIYERFWNGLLWVIAPHDLPVAAGYAVSVFMVNQSILALSETGILYQMQLTEDSQPIWIEFMPVFDQSTSKETDESSSEIKFTSGVTSQDRETMFLCTKNGSLLELRGVDPLRWINHGRPPGANVATIADAATIRPGVLFTLRAHSSAGDLYEYDQTSKPPWKKHIRREDDLRKDTSLAPLRGCSLHGLIGAHSVSLFLLTKGGELVERRLHQRKWKWVVHGNPKGHLLSSITCISQDEFNENSNSLFLTTANGFIFEYQIPKHSGNIRDQEVEENWMNHMHPPNARAARGITGLHLQAGRMVFPLDDGRLAELHLSGLGGENSGPSSQVYTRRKSSSKYIWSVLDAPETEGWNAEYCVEERGPLNCIVGTKDEISSVSNTRSSSRRRKDGKPQQNYLSIGASDDSISISANSMEGYSMSDNWIKNFRLRLMQGGKSFFLITDSGSTFEYLNTENVWFWLKHEHQTAMKGVLGNYNGSFFLVDENGSLLIRERNNNDLTWVNCTAMRKGRQVIGGPPWDGLPGRAPKAKPEDSIFFVSKTGRLLQFTVALRKFKWKDCKNPPSTKIASIVDQEGFRENIVFIIGTNNRLYQYNKVTELWHEHHQSQHLVLSRSYGTATRSSSTSLKGSIFMLSDEGGLVEYHWNLVEGWNWIEHGTPYTDVTLVGSPGPCFGGTELFLIGSDGNVYLRYFDQTSWKWRDCGFPFLGSNVDEKSRDEEVCVDKDLNANKNCDPKVSSTRPIPFNDDSVIFELRDGRLAEIRRMGDKNWEWTRTIGTPSSLCMTNFWTTLAS